MSAKKDAANSNELLYRDMSPSEKLSFITKAFVFFLSGGFIYPTLWID